MNMQNFKEFNLDEALDTHAAAMAHKDKASKALETSDMKSFHAHMASHHESMGQWHESKGRHSAADREYAKGEEHHEKSLKPDNSRTVGAKNEEVVSEAMPGSLSKSDYTPGARKSLKDTEKTSKFKVATNAVGGHKEQQVEVDATSKNHALNQAAEHFAKKGLKPRVHFDGLRIKESAICSACQSDPCICDDSHGFVSEAAQGHTIEAQGIRGMKATPWRKTFKNHEHLAKWADANDSVEVHGTRDLDQARKGNLSPAMKEEAQAKHRVGVTVSKKDHPMVSKRLEKQQKFVKVSAGSKEEAVTKAKKFYTKQGYHVHGAEHHSVSEEVELQEDDTHAVHVNGRQWKTFSTKAHAENVAKKIKGATVHKYDADRLKNQYHAKLSARNAARGKEWDESSSVPSFKEFVEESPLDKFKKYTRPVVKTTPKMEKTTNPAGRTTDHTEWKVTTHTGEIHRYNSKKEAQAHFDSLPK